MDKIVAGLIGTVALAAGALTSAQAAQREALHASCYADLLRPIPNALAIEASARSAVPDAAEVPVVLAQYHHHHHRHVYHRRHYHHDY